MKIKRMLFGLIIGILGGLLISYSFTDFIDLTKGVSSDNLATSSLIQLRMKLVAPVIFVVFVLLPIYLTLKHSYLTIRNYERKVYAIYFWICYAISSSIVLLITQL